MPDAESLTHPGGQTLYDATSWIAGLLFGSIATMTAILAIAWLGGRMLSGNVDLRRGTTTILGGFLLFGAVTIANGLRGLAGSATPNLPPPDPLQAFAPSAISDTGISSPAFDPYAGASVPDRR